MSSMEGTKKCLSAESGNEKIACHKKKRGGYNKKRRRHLIAAGNDCDGINVDTLGIVMDFLSPKELYRVAFTSKALLNKVTIRMVVRSALFSGGNANKTVSELYPLMADGSIHPPSPVRLLRLVNGKKCEACLYRKVNHARAGYGVFLCWGCTKDRFTKTLKTTWVEVVGNPRYKDILKHKRVAAQGCGRNFHTWNRRLKAKNGEECGPFVTFDDIVKMAQEPLIGIDDMLMHLPPLDVYAEYVEAYKAFANLARMAEKQRSEKKLAITEAASENRKAKSEQIIGKVQKLLDVEWRDFALKNYDTNLTGNNACVYFNSPFCNALLRLYVTSPSKVKKNIIQDIADRINFAFQVLKQSPMYNFEFLSQDGGFESALKSHCIARFDDFTSLVLDSRADHHFFNLMHKKKYFEALDRLLEGFAVVLLSPEVALAGIAQEKEYAKESWCYRRFFPLSAPPLSAPEANRKKMACTIWAYEQGRLNGDSDLYDPMTLSKLFESSCASLRECDKAMNEFKDFTVKKGDDHCDEFLRYACRKIRSDKKYISPLLSRDFKKITLLVKGIQFD